MGSLICFLGVPYSSTYIFVFNNTIHISQCSSKNKVSQIKMSEFAKILWSAWILYHCRRDSNPVYRMVGKYGCTTTYGGPRKFVLLFQPKHRSNRRWNFYCDDFLFFKDLNFLSKIFGIFLFLSRIWLWIIFGGLGCNLFCLNCRIVPLVDDVL